MIPDFLLVIHDYMGGKRKAATVETKLTGVEGVIEMTGHLDHS